MAESKFDFIEDKLSPKGYIDNLFNYINYLHKYFNLLIEIGEAKELMKQEIKTEFYQHGRYERLANECVKIYNGLLLNFNQDLIDLGNIVTIELEKRNITEQRQFHQKITDLFKEIEVRIKKTVSEIGFSKESIGMKFKTILVETKDGGREEKKVEYNFSTAMLFYDLVDKLNQLKKLIDGRFKYLFSISNLDTNELKHDSLVEGSERENEDNANESGMRDYIESQFEPKKERCFEKANNELTYKGYNVLMELLTNFFESKNYTIPKDKIQLKARCKTAIAPIFNTIYMQKKSCKTPLKSDTKYFEIIRVLNHFEGLSDSEIYKTIGR